MLLLGPGLLLALLVPPPLTHCETPRAAAFTLAAQQRTDARTDVMFPSSTLLAALQPDWLGAPAANQNNPGGAGNAEGVSALGRSERGLFPD